MHDEELKKLWEKYTVALQELRESMQNANNKISQVKTDNLNKDISLRGYATESFVTQTSTNVEMKFTQSGGYNLLYNGDFKREGSNWDLINPGKIVFLSGISCPNGLGVRLFSSLGDNVQLNQEFGMNDSLETITVSYFTYVDNDENQTDGSTNPFRRSEIRIEYKDGTYEYHQIDNVIEFRKWEKKSITITPSKRMRNVRVTLYNRDTTRYVYYSAVQVEKGSIATEFVQNPNEIYDGITTVDRDGVKVEMIDGEGSQGYATLSYDGIATYDNNGNTKSWFGADDSAYIKELNVDNINNPHVIQCKPRATNWYVGVYATGDGSGRDISNKSNSIQSVLEKVRNDSGAYNYMQDLNITCDSGMNLNENIYIGGWIGASVIRIQFGAGSTFTGYIKIEDCGSAVILDGNKTNWGTNDGCKWYRTDGNTGSAALYSRNSTVLCRGFRTHRGVGLSTYGNLFALSDYGSSITLYNNDLVKYWCVGKSTNGSELYVDSTRGDIGILSEGVNNSTICARAQLPIFDNGKKVDNGYNAVLYIDGTEGSNSLWMPKPTPEVPDPPKPPTPSESWNWVEKTFSFKLWSTVEGSGSTTSTWSGKWGQGKYGSYKPHRGHAQPTENISSWCNVGSKTRNISMVLTMTRLNTSHGQAGAVPKPKLRQKDGSFWDSGVAFARGDTKSITLPSGVVSGLSDGALSELTMWAGTSTTEYSQYNNVTVKVKCEKYY